jgi:hypothetical protein
MESEGNSPSVRSVTKQVSTHNAVCLAIHIRAGSSRTLHVTDLPPSRSQATTGADPPAANVREQNSEISAGAPMGKSTSSSVLINVLFVFLAARMIGPSVCSLPVSFVK